MMCGFPGLKKTTCMLWVAFVALSVLINVSALGQIQMADITLASQNVEPSGGQSQVIFSFSVKDIDPLSDDNGGVVVNCLLIQNLGTATASDLLEISLRNTGIQTPSTTTTIDVPSGAAATAECPAGAPAGGNVAFEAFIPRSTFNSATDFDISDDATITVQLAVKVQNSAALKNTSQNHTLSLRVTVQFTESVGSPPSVTTFTDSISDALSDRVINAGINQITPLSFNNNSIPIDATTQGLVGSFQVCDQDANAKDLKITSIRLSQGIFGNALSNDVKDFEILIGGVSFGIKPPTTGFDPGGVGFEFTLTNGIIPDEACKVVDIKAKIASTAQRGRKIHLNVVFSTSEGETIDGSAAPALQVSQVVLLGSGILSFPDVGVAGSSIPLQLSDFPIAGLGRIDVQTNSVRFDPSVVQIDSVTLPAGSPYILETFTVDNRAGTLKFVLRLNPPQSLSAVMSGTLLNVNLSRKGNPKDRSPFILQVDRVEDRFGTDVTAGIVIVSGSVTLLSPGDVDSDGVPTVRDALLTANAILASNCTVSTTNVIIDLTPDQAHAADVALPNAAANQPVTCQELNSSDVKKIAELAITFGIGGVPTGAASATKASSQIQQLPWWQRLLQTFVKLQKPSEPARVNSVIANGRLLVHIESKRPPGGVQGRVYFDPTALHILAVHGLNGQTVLAAEIDNVAGEVRFVTLASWGQDAQGSAIVSMEIESMTSAPSVQLQIDYLLDARGEKIPHLLTSETEKRPAPLAVQAVRLATLQSTHWQLQILGSGIAAAQIEGFDLAGRRRFAAETAGDTLQWQMLDGHGRSLANGVYLYVVTVRGQSGEVWRSEVRKLVLLR